MPIDTSGSYPFSKKFFFGAGDCYREPQQDKM